MLDYRTVVYLVLGRKSSFSTTARYRWKVSLENIIIAPYQSIFDLVNREFRFSLLPLMYCSKKVLNLN
jgi:hypothetical protein